MNSYAWWIIIILGALACDRQPEPQMVKQLITGEINGRSFRSEITVPRGAFVYRNMCGDEEIWINLVRKIGEETYQMVFIEYIPPRPGTYMLTDSIATHRQAGVCDQEGVRAASFFKAYLIDDIQMNSYRLLEGPWNYLKILQYDRAKKRLVGEFAAKFVRIEAVQRAFEAEDTIAYTHTKFSLSNLQISEPH